MNERLVVKSFGPIKDIDITFKKVTIFIGDQGTGKSCIAKLFSMFKWLEKTIASNRIGIRYYEIYDRFKKKACAYHRIESFFHDETYIHFDGTLYTFEYKDGNFTITDKKNHDESLPKIMYIPAERTILSVAESTPNLLKELPDSCEAFYDEFTNAKQDNKDGYDLPFSALKFKYDSLNGISWIEGGNHRVRLTNASSGIQSALPLCMVSESLSRRVQNNEEIKQTQKEKAKMEKQVAEIMQNEDLSDSIRKMMLKQLSAKTKYGCFINIAEEPELNLFPLSQMEVLISLVKNNNSSAGNMLVLTTHSPYTLSILNNMILASIVADKGDDETQKVVYEIIPQSCQIHPNDIVAVRLSETEEEYCKTIISEKSNLIAKNALDSVSEEIMQKFNSIYRLYAKVTRN